MLEINTKRIEENSEKNVVSFLTKGPLNVFFFLTNKN